MSEKKKVVKMSQQVSVVQFLNNLAGVLENPKLKSVQWDAAGAAILVNPKLYEKEIEEQGHLLQALKKFKSFSMLHGLLCSCGFKKKNAKADAAVHVFQHADFKKKVSVATPGKDGLQGEVAQLRKRKKKSKKQRKEATAERPPTAAASSCPGGLQTVFPQTQHPRSLYQYINYDHPEMNTASDPEMDSEEADGLRDIACEEKMADLPMSHSPPAHVKEERSLKPILHLAFASPAQSELDKSTQVDIDKMLSVCAAHLVPPLSPHSL